MTSSLVDQFYYSDNTLHIESSSVVSIAERIGTPFYCYSEARLLENISRCKAAFEPFGIGIHYAMKANSNLHVLRLVAAQGLGVDLVSEGEMFRALKAGFAPSSMIFSGVGKTVSEFFFAIENGIGQFNVESVEELAVLAMLATDHSRAVNVALRINPNVEVDTHQNITTGVKGNKFGIAIDQVYALGRLYATHPFINIDGLAMHIGSQICDESPYREAIVKIIALANSLQAEGVSISSLDLGGGFGIDYGDGNSLDFERIAKVIASEAAHFEGRVVVEPGRSLVGDAGVLVSRVTYVKEANPRPFLIVDAGMNDLMRPALYQSEHPVLPVSCREEELTRNFDIVGPICESTDTFMQDYSLNCSIKSGDLVTFGCAGAYGAVMSSSYNSRDIIPEVLVSGKKTRLIRRRLDQKELVSLEEG